MILQFLWESRGRLFKESYRNVTLLFCFCAYSIIYFAQDSPLATSGWFPQITYNMRPFYLGVVSPLYFFGKVPKTLALRF